MMDETEVLELVHACFEANLHPGAEGLQNDGAWFRSKTGMRTVISTDAFAEEIDLRMGHRLPSGRQSHQTKPFRSRRHGCSPNGLHLVAQLVRNLAWRTRAA